MESIGKSGSRKSKGALNCSADDILSWASEYYHLNLVIFVTWMLSLTVMLVLFFAWMKSSVANEEKERHLAAEARKVSQQILVVHHQQQQHSPRNDVTERTTNELQSRVSLETNNSRTSSGLSPQSLGLLSSTPSPVLGCSRKASRKQDVTSSMYAIEMSEATYRQQETKAVIHM